MSNNLLSAFAIVTVIGFSAALLPRLAAPSDSYISESLEPTEEPFYFVDNPDSVSLPSSEHLFLSASTNRSDCVYSWEYKTPSMTKWYSVTNGVSMYGYYYNPYLVNSQPILVYRCKAVFNDMTIYSAPCLVMIISPSKGLEKSEEFEELEKDVEFEEFEQVEVFEENERSVENAE